jgi:multidrug efflux pump subunit AcrA (membrane-fusion protein)
LIGGLIVVGVAAIIVGFAFRPTSNTSASALTATVSTGDVTLSVSASGSVVDEFTYGIAPGATALIEQAGVTLGATPNAQGFKTSAVKVSAGDHVKAGTVLATVIDATGNTVLVKSPTKGIVRSVTTAARASASTVATIGSGRELVSVAVSEYDVSKLKVGQTVDLTLGATKAAITGDVISVGQAADATSGVKQYQVLIAPTNLPDTARIGMTVTASINVSSATGVLSVPSTAITTIAGHSIVRVVQKDGSTVPTPVTLGLVGDSTVEIKSGLAAGDVVTIGTTGTIPATTSGGFGGGSGSRVP